MIIPPYGDGTDGEGTVCLDAAISDAVVQPTRVERRQDDIDLHLRGCFLRLNQQGDKSRNR
jgi:hypothetical protein